MRRVWRAVLHLVDAVSLTRCDCPPDQTVRDGWDWSAGELAAAVRRADMWVGGVDGDGFVR